MNRHTISVLVENSAGVLSQITRLFARKSYNIHSLAVGVTQDPDVSRITIITLGNDDIVRQIYSQLRKQVSVISVEVMGKSESVQRELLLVKVKAGTKDARDGILQIVNVFRASVVDMSLAEMIIAVQGDESKTEAILRLLGDFGILEMARTGMTALERGASTIYEGSRDLDE